MTHVKKYFVIWPMLSFCLQCFGIVGNGWASEEYLGCCNGVNGTGVVIGLE